MPKRTIFFDDNRDTTLGGRVFQAREATGMTVAQVINRLGVRKATHMAWEADRLNHGPINLALAGILNVSPTYLLSGLGGRRNNRQNTYKSSTNYGLKSNSSSKH